MTRALAIFIALAAGTVSAAPAASQCTHETLTVESRPLTIDYCISGAVRSNGVEELIVPVNASFSASGGSLQRASVLHFIAGEGVSRVLESLDLTKVGLTGTLHLTLAYSHGLVSVEGALLTPGAITIK
jgi:hypothetical protein